MNLFNPDKIEFWIMIFIVIIAIIISNKYLDKAKFNILRSMDQKILRYGLVSKRMLCELTRDKFTHWCIDLLDRTGYTNIETLPESDDRSSYLICRKNGIRFLVVCAQLDLNKPALNEDDYMRFGRPYAQIFVGNMRYKGIYNGLIITTGYFSQHVKPYIDSLDKIYNIKLIDGDELSLLHWMNVEEEIILNKSIQMS